MRVTKTIEKIESTIECYKVHFTDGLIMNTESSYVLNFSKGEEVIHQSFGSFKPSQIFKLKQK